MFAGKYPSLLCPIETRHHSYTVSSAKYESGACDLAAIISETIPSMLFQSLDPIEMFSVVCCQRQIVYECDGQCR